MSDQFPIHSDDDAHNRRAMTPARAAQLAAAASGTPALLDQAVDNERAGDDEAIDLLAYWRVLMKHKWLVAGVMGTVTALALLYTLIATPIYRATAVMEIAKEDQQFVPGAALQSGDGWDPEFLETQVRLLQSRSLAERVADTLGLDGENAAYQPPPSAFERVMGLLRPAQSKQASSPSAPAARTRRGANALAAGTGLVQGGLSVVPIRNSKLVQVNYESPDPAFSARVVNAIAEGFIQSSMERKFGASSYARTYLEEQLKLAKDRLENSERQLVAYAQKEGIVNTGAQGQSLATQNLSDLNTALAAAQDQRIRTEARWRQAQGGALPADMMASSIIGVLRQQRAQLQAQYQEKLQVYKPDYPLMQQLKGQIDELDKQMAGEMRNVRNSVQAEYQAAANQESMLQGKIAALRTQALDVDGRSIQYNILKREVDTGREIYDGLLQRYKEIGVSEKVRSNNISIIDRAIVPTSRYKPNLRLNLMIGLLLGLLLGVAAALVVEYVDDTLKTPDDIEQRLRLPVLGIIPKLKKVTPSEALEDQRSSFSEAYRSVRTALQFSTQHGVPRVLLVTSAAPGEGKSTTALSLAKGFTQIGKRVLLIEADMRNPSLHRTLGRRSDTGLSNLLSGAVSLEDVTLETDESGLKVILAGPLPPNPAELLAGSRLASLLTIATQSHDVVLIDGPPVIGIADAPLLSNVAEATLLVVRSGVSRNNAATAALKRLRAAHAHLIGVVLTSYDAKVAGYDYHYNYKYYTYGNRPQLSKE